MWGSNYLKIMACYWTNVYNKHLNSENLLLSSFQGNSIKKYGGVHCNKPMIWTFEACHDVSSPSSFLCKDIISSFIIKHTCNFYAYQVKGNSILNNFVFLGLGCIYFYGCPSFRHSVCNESYNFFLKGHWNEPSFETIGPHSIFSCLVELYFNKVKLKLLFNEMIICFVRFPC